MKNIIILLSAVLITVAFTKCTPSDPIDLLPLLKKSWTHSREEDTSEQINIYRPSDFKEYPLSWYRQVFRFKNNDTCEYFVLSPDDGHYFDTGKWSYDKASKKIRIFDRDNVLIYTLEVLELKNEILKVKWIW